MDKKDKFNYFMEGLWMWAHSEIWRQGV
ncbi:unnamed protein product [Spirodela intermedia]|uniref:Uncharacterized protein n=1 Tax=Spirodela intermedia TaxID=51605 RepID=A0A7I8LKT4_SPIIN|nr:unnamed protein product [Spirodela intermedia]